MRDNFYIITGGPGAGKTTLLEELSRYEVLCVPEVARQIISPAALADEYRYNRLVFILPPWEEIYATDNERKQTFEEAIDVFRRLEEEYMSCGYEVVEVPCISVEERALFVLNRIGMHRKQ